MLVTLALALATANAPAPDAQNIDPGMPESVPAAPAEGGADRMWSAVASLDKCYRSAAVRYAPVSPEMGAAVAAVRERCGPEEAMLLAVETGLDKDHFRRADFETERQREAYRKVSSVVLEWRLAHRVAGR